MNQNEEPDFQIELSSQIFGLPTDVSSDSKVFVEINKSSSESILTYSISDTSQELGGVLLGNCKEKDGQYHVCVRAVIEARYTESTKGSVTFTHQTWDYINRIRDEKYPQYKVVGWFHTHPGFGIFLSGHDKFIHQNFFNLPWQIAYVVDPLAGKHGFFGWINNHIEEVPFKAEVSPRYVQTSEIQLPKKKTKTKTFNKVSSAVAVAALLFANGYFFLSNQEANRCIRELEIALSKMESSYNIQQSEIALLQEANIELDLLFQDMSQTKPFFIYTIMENDTLWSISEKHLGDGYLYMELARLNNLHDPDMVQIGNKLFIPLTYTEAE